MSTKSIRISDKVHAKLKVHVARNGESIVEFADRAITNAMNAYRNLNLTPQEISKVISKTKHQ